MTNAEYGLRYRRKHREVLRLRLTKYIQSKKTLVITLLGSKCIRCGFDDVRALQIDHINGGGSKEVAIFSRSTYLNRVIKSIKEKEGKYQLLCANCNWIKKSENHNEHGGRKITF